MNIDTEIYRFIEKIRKREPTYETPVYEGKFYGAGTVPILDLGEVTEMRMTELDEDDFSEAARYETIDGQIVGLNKESYKELTLLLVPLLETTFKSKCSLKFLVDTTFDWLLEVYKTKRANYNLTTYLSDRISDETKEHHFYFSVKALAIERPLQIGNATITFFSEEEIQDYYNQYNSRNPGKTFNEFKDFFSPHFNSISAIVKVRGIGDMAEAIAFKEVELAIDALKCFCLPFCMNSMDKIFDLDYRVDKSSIAYYLNMVDGDINQSTARLHKFNDIAPTRLSNAFVDQARKIGLDSFSQFIKNKKDNDLADTIVELIRQLSAIVSTENNYEKAAKTISLLESVIVPKKSGKSKGLGRIKKVVPNIVRNQQEQEEILNNLIACYDIRDKYLHNNIKLPIDKSGFKRLLFFNVEFILALMKLNISMETVEEALNYFDIK